MQTQNINISQSDNKAEGSNFPNLLSKINSFLVRHFTNSLIRFFSLVDSRLILPYRLVDSQLSVAAQSPPNVLPKSSHLRFLCIVYFRSVCRNTLIFNTINILISENQSPSSLISVQISLYPINSFFNSFKEIPQLLPRSPPIHKTLEMI